ncbi:MAG: metal ABC transporter solute-binding protein, Zn/Mn family [Actinomycetota bacterium]
MNRVVRLLAGLAIVAGLVACSTSGDSANGGKPKVVAAENFWGSIAAQLGGDRVDVTSIITNPNADPHDYEPTTADARDLASAEFVIVNGIGYDPWVDRLLAANPVQGREVLNVGHLAGVPDDGNPHQWYSPSTVQLVIDAINADYRKLDPAHGSYFDRERTRFERQGLGGYHALIASIKKKYAGTPVGASESIFALLAPALGLNLITPPAFLRAISEGTEPSAADKATIDHQIQAGQITVFVYNSQNATPDVQRQIDEARASGIPVTTVTETLVPEGASFQAWQVRQLRALAAALARGTGR